jgi:hypothetical protein
VARLPKTGMLGRGCQADFFGVGCESQFLDMGRGPWVFVLDVSVNIAV